MIRFAIVPSSGQWRRRYKHHERKIVQNLHRPSAPGKSSISATLRSVGTVAGRQHNFLAAGQAAPASDRS